MAQISWRAPDALVDRVRAAAAARNWSVNEFLTRIADAATDPDLAGTDAERTRERLARAGLLIPAGPPRGGPAPDAEELAAARAEAGRGKPLSDFVTEGRGPR